MRAPRLASEIAAVLGERDILRSAPGSRDADLRLRVGALRGVRDALPGGLTVDARALRQAQRAAADWQRELGGREEIADPDAFVGVLTALAYPDRVGHARDGSGRYLLANGRGARFAEPQALAKSEFIVAAELDGADRDARIFFAAPLEREDIERLFKEQIEERSEIVWDEREEVVRARKQRRLGALVLRSEDLRDADPEAIAQAALVGLRRLGLDALPWTPSLRQWQARVLLMGKFAVPAAEPWPDVSDAALSATLEDWAPPWMTGLVRREHFARFDLNQRVALAALLRPGQRARARGAYSLHGAERLEPPHRLCRR